MCHVSGVYIKYVPFQKQRNHVLFIFQMAKMMLILNIVGENIMGVAPKPKDKR
jgi:hypothetical protein